MSTVCLELHYLPEAAFFAPPACGYPVILEGQDHYQKKTGRNRCRILSAHGAVSLSIPLVKGKHQGMPYRDVRIAWDMPWNRTHWRTIRSSYGRAPFFTHYAESLSPLFERSPIFLWDWNILLLEWSFQQIGLPLPSAHTELWYATYGEEILDLRGPQGESFIRSLDIPPYPQVFADRLAFTSGLSILDLLFCTGPEAATILRRCFRTEA